MNIIAFCSSGQANYDLIIRYYSFKSSLTLRCNFYVKAGVRRCLTNQGETLLLFVNCQVVNSKVHTSWSWEDGDKPSKAGECQGEAPMMDSGHFHPTLEHCDIFGTPTSKGRLKKSKTKSRIQTEE